MTHLSNDGVIIEAEEDGKCELCGAISETRPYGPGFARICFDCAMKDEQGTAARFDHLAFDKPLPDDMA